MSEITISVALVSLILMCVILILVCSLRKYMQSGCQLVSIQFLVASKVSPTLPTNTNSWTFLTKKRYVSCEHKSSLCVHLILTCKQWEPTHPIKLNFLTFFKDGLTTLVKKDELSLSFDTIEPLCVKSYIHKLSTDNVARISKWQVCGLKYGSIQREVCTKACLPMLFTFSCIFEQKIAKVGWVGSLHSQKKDWMNTCLRLTLTSHVDQH